MIGAPVNLALARRVANRKRRAAHAAAVRAQPENVFRRAVVGRLKVPPELAHATQAGAPTRRPVAVATQVPPRHVDLWRNVECPHYEVCAETAWVQLKRPYGQGKSPAPVEARSWACSPKCPFRRKEAQRQIPSRPSEGVATAAAGSGRAQAHCSTIGDMVADLARAGQTREETVDSAIAALNKQRRHRE